MTAVLMVEIETKISAVFTTISYIQSVRCGISYFNCSPPPSPSTNNTATAQTRIQKYLTAGCIHWLQRSICFFLQPRSLDYGVPYKFLDWFWLCKCFILADAVHLTFISMIYTLQQQNWYRWNNLKRILTSRRAQTLSDGRLGGHVM